MVIQFPGGSKGRVNKAGEQVAKGIQTDEDVAVINEWRSAHKAILNTFQASLRNRTVNQDIIVAQRHKRLNTIIDKLSRFPNMRLSRMDDVAGCRLIFNNTENLYEFRSAFHNAKFNHKRRNDVDKYDYIKNPKQTGYRGIHDIYEYDVRSTTNSHLKGMLIELQYRTKIQHAWATTVEIIGHFSGNQPKFQRGDTQYMNAMLYASEIFSRAHEGMFGSVPDWENRRLFDEFDLLDRRIHLTRSLEGLTQATQSDLNMKNIILIFKNDGSLEIESFQYAPEALKRLIVLEKIVMDKILFLFVLIHLRKCVLRIKTIFLMLMIFYYY